jgi:YfiH family protein
MNSNNFNDDIKLEINDNGVELVKFSFLEKYEEFLVHCFTTRNGGVSQGECSTLNLGYNRNDKKENVTRNFKLVSEALNVSFENFVLSNQVHDNRIKIVNKGDRGKGIIKKSDIIGFDGLITNEKDVALVTFYADCIPIYMIDIKKEVIALLHSGWRSTYREISMEALEIFEGTYNSNLNDIIVLIGPSIYDCCFEIDRDVLDLFIDKFSLTKEYYSKRDDKWILKLQKIIVDTLIARGINKKNIFNSKLCTKCNKKYFFSHRGDKGKTGALSAIMQLK